VRIVIDYRPALRARTGVGEHVHQLVSHLARNNGDDVTVFSSSWRDRLRPDSAAEWPRAHQVDRRIPVRMLNLGWHRLEWPPIEQLATGPFDIAHSPHPLLMPSQSAAQVVTIHDLYFLTHPERTTGEIKRDYTALAGAHARRADRIVVVSRFVAGEVERQLDVPADRISVCPNGAPEWEASVTPTPADGYVLFVGTLEPRKNIGGLFDAFGRVLQRASRPPRLVIAGGGPDAATWTGRATMPPLAGHVECRGYVPAEERESLYRGAQMLVLPSFDEGFGIPALEAMTAGVPVIVSNRGALPEVVGDAGLLIDPDDPESLAAAILLLARDATLRANLSRRGIDRARQFTWAQMARDVRRAYEQAMSAKLNRMPPPRDAHRH
jgi:glycosyltransferase involved in cell wall biosynthesis